MATTKKQTRRPPRRLNTEERRPPSDIPSLGPLDVTDRNPQEGFLKFALRYVREVAREDQTFFGFMVGSVFLWALLSIAALALLTIGGGISGFASAIFLTVFVLPGLCAPLFIPAYMRLWIPLRVISDHGRIDSWIHPKWRRILGHNYTWKINGSLGVVMNLDRTPFIGRQTRPIVSDSAIYIDLDVTDLRKMASTPGISWQTLDPGIWIAAFGIVAFMILVLLSPSPPTPVT